MRPAQAREWNHRWALFLLASVGLHALLYLALRHAAEVPRAPAKLASTIDISLEAPSPPPNVARPPTEMKSPRAKPSSPSRAPLPKRERMEVAAPSPSSSTELPAAPEVVPRRLDLTLQAPPPAFPDDGATRRQSLGDLPEAPLPSIADERIAGWIQSDDARRRVEKGLVDDWFIRLGTSLTGALKESPPPPPDTATVAREMTKGYFRFAAKYGQTGTVGHTRTEDSDPSSGNANDGNVPFARPKAQVERVLQSTAPVWAILDLEYSPGGALTRSRVVSSSGNSLFDAHVLKVVAGGLPGLPDVPDAGLGIHARGTYSVWQVEGHLTFERDVRTFDAKKDAWYVPIAALTALAGATGGAFDEVSGYVGFTDFRHPRVNCDVKLLQVY